MSGGLKFVLYPSGPRTFTYKLVNATVTFGPPGADGTANTAVHHQNGHDFPMKRVHRTPLTAAELQDREGEFYRPQRAFTAIKTDPGALDSLVGYYQLSPDVVVTVTRSSERLFSQLTRRVKYELFPLGNRDYYVRAADFQTTFTADSQGNAVGMVVRHDGIQQVGRRIDAAAAKAVEDFPQRRLVENVPLPGSEATLHRILNELRASPDYSRMTPMLAQAVGDALLSIQAELNSLGTAKSLEFIGVGYPGVDVYVVHFSNGDAEWRIRLTSDGTPEWLEHHPLKDATHLPLTNVSALRSPPDGGPTTLELLNRTNNPLRVYSIDQEGQIKSEGSVEHLKTQPAEVGEIFMVGQDESHPVTIFRAVPGLSLGTVN
jgi:hypothetical protein